MVQNLALGIGLTLAGMGLVFALLALLWLTMTVLLRLDSRQSGEEERGGRGERVSVVPSPTSASTAELSPEMLAAVMVAVRMHRRIRRKQAAPAMRSHQPGTLPSRWIGAGRTSQNQNWHRGRR